MARSPWLNPAGDLGLHLVDLGIRHGAFPHGVLVLFRVHICLACPFSRVFRRTGRGEAPVVRPGGPRDRGTGTHWEGAGGANVLEGYLHGRYRYGVGAVPVQEPMVGRQPWFRVSGATRDGQKVGRHGTGSWMRDSRMWGESNRGVACLGGASSYSASGL